MGVGGSPGPHKKNEGCPHACADVSACGLCFQANVLDGERPLIGIMHGVLDMRLKMNEVLLVQAPAAAVTSLLPLEQHGIKEKDSNTSGCGPNERHPENTCAG